MKYKDNPFSLDFGAKPELYIPRVEEENKIYRTFMAERPSSHLYMIIGARGMGKTALMTAITDKIKQEEDWISIDLDSEENTMQDFLYQLQDKIKTKFPKVKLSVDLKLISLDVSWEEKAGSIRLELDKLLEILVKHNQRLLITIDEAVNSVQMREFASYYQHCLREKYPVFVLMTGLFKNIRALQNNRSLTFLRRATKVELKPLSIGRVSVEFEKNLNLSSEEAIRLAKLTSGYSYAFQMLGHLMFDSGKKVLEDEVYRDYKYTLYENSYEKIWEELSDNEQKIVEVIAAEDDEIAVADIKEKMKMDNNNFSTYRDTLLKSGLIINTSYGMVELCLPLFKEFVREYYL